jgi:predicted hotdog family 3-hydroxylacyl-ACP dehydratase
LTGDYLASDPLCWSNAERQEEIARLPFPAADLIPHQAPMRVIDALVACGDRSGEAAVTISHEMPFVGEDGALDEVVYFEMIAQSIAALNGFKQLGTQTPASEGFLVGARKLEFLEPARVGDTLNIFVRKHARFGKIGIVTATISRDKTVLARGEIKIHHDAVRNGQEARRPAGDC